MTDSSRSTLSRRKFLADAAGGAAVTLAAPAVIAAAADASSAVIIGEGEHRYQVVHQWPQLPDRYQWQTTHGVALDRDGFLYVIHEGRAELKDHPSIFVFDPAGKFVRAFGSQFQGGGHGLEVRQEGGSSSCTSVPTSR